MGSGMREGKENEEIIELTEVVEEGILNLEVRLQEPAIPESTPENLPGESPPPQPEEKHSPGIGEGASQPSRDLPLPPGFFLQDSGAESQPVKETLKAQVEKWVASEGARVLERVAKEMFPRIAEEVLRREIEKLKAEAEEKE